MREASKVYINQRGKIYMREASKIYINQRGKRAKLRIGTGNGWWVAAAMAALTIQCS